MAAQFRSFAANNKKMLTELLSTYQVLLKENPLVAGGLSVYSLGMVTWFLRNVPQRISNLLVYQTTTSLTLMSSGAGSADMQYFNFLRWFRERGFMKYSRSLAVENTWRHSVSVEDRHGQLTAGDGRHYFFWKGRLCWLTKVRLEQGGTTNEITYSLKLTMIGRSHDKVLSALEEFRWRPNEDEAHLYHHTEQGDWCTTRSVAPRKIETVILNGDLKERILGSISWFLENKQWYVDRGLPYRLVLLFYGPPGTGKSSLLRALASHFTRNLCPLTLSSLTDDSLGNMIRSVPDESIMVIEDCDSCDAILKPEFASEHNGSQKTKLSKTGVLQALDGIDTLDGQIIILTTNYLERLEPSIIREERVNEQFYLGPLDNDSIHLYIDQMFPNNEHMLTGLEFAPIAGAVLQKYYKLHHQNYQDFIATIPVLNPDKKTTTAEEIV